ncbi:MAG: hypothetical protein U0401_19365 [Anaerolineae bacterium]
MLVILRPSFCCPVRCSALSARWWSSPALADLNRTGDVVGRIYAAGAGSVAQSALRRLFPHQRLWHARLLAVWGVAGGLLLINVFHWPERVRYAALRCGGVIVY